MASNGARLVLLRQQRSRISSSLAPRRIMATPLRPWTTTSSSLYPILRLQQQQRRHYIFLPSDWSELTYRWKLFWETHTPTKVRLKVQDRRSRIKARYQAQRSKLQARFQTERTRIRARYQFQKLRLQRRVRIQRDYLQRRYQENYKPYYQRQQQRRREFTKRWSARRRDILQDSTDMVKGYLLRNRQTKKTRVFTLEEYARPHWFDSNGRPLTSRDPTGRFVNPWLSWSTNGVHSIASILAWRYQRAVRQWKERGLMSILPKDLPQLLFGSALAKSNPDKPQTTNRWKTPPPATEIQFTWIGHSTCLVQMGQATILTDPIFSHRCTPFPRLPGVGVAREVPPSIGLEDLPDKIDVCLISHDHYDHMDQLTILALRDRVQHWVLPQGLPQWLESRCSVDPNTMTELQWWESVQLELVGGGSKEGGEWQIAKDGPSNNNSSSTMTITCCPAQHWSSRTFFDRCKRLWCGFAVETQTHANDKPVVQKFFFAGDTGMPRNEFPLFSQIGEFCGRGMYHQQPQPTTYSNDKDKNASSAFHPFDLAAIPIGAYDPSFLMQEAHMNPSEAVHCARQLQARKSVAIHWGTFALSEEPMEEPPLKLQEALEMPKNEGIDFVALPIGGSLTIPAVGAELAVGEKAERALAETSGETKFA